MELEICPCCPRGCKSNDLHCPRGKQHFNLPVTQDELTHLHHHEKYANMTIDEKIISLTKKCGHHLKHNESMTNEDLLSCLNEDEKLQLFLLLKKCIKHWNKK